MTDYLFSYGTLQDPDVQLANFGRRLDGTSDALPGYRLDWLLITDPQVIEVSGSGGLIRSSLTPRTSPISLPGPIRAHP